MEPPPSRHDALMQWDAGLVDVLVIGGGVVGAGIARDAAMRGLSVALAERNDFAFGASSRSSRLLHGGLRYLAQGRLRLVREAAVEKMVLGRIAPHLTRPTPFVFPTYRGTSWKLWKLRIGVKIYDRLAGRRNFGASRGMDPGEVLKLLPGLRGEHLTGAVRYFDAVTFDARLVIDTLRSAASHGARLFNYLSFESAERRGDVWHCRLDDRLAGRRVELTARTVVNAAGASADRFPQSRVQLRLTKGVHLVIPRERLPVPEAVVMTEGPRILFAIPWGERVILGTTDTDYAGDVESPTCEPQDVRYILDVTNRTFPAAGVSRADVISTWAGLRPLIASSAGGPSDISRAHHIGMTEPGWLDVAGGKLTTYRLIAEQTVDRVVALLGAAARPCTTREEPLIAEDSARAFSGVLPPEVSREAVEHFCRTEWAVHLDDVMVRRTGWQHYHDNAADIARRACGWMAEALDWSPEHARAEFERYGALMQQSRGCIAET
jgi:glycerol-3-phosphate dehydrogenase